MEFLIDANGNTQRSEASKGKFAAAYFKNLFTSSSPTAFQNLLQGFHARVSQEMNDRLIRHVSVEEVKEVVFAIKLSSAPGTDGMSGLFFQKY